MDHVTRWASEGALVASRPAPADEALADLAAALSYFVRSYLHEHGFASEGIAVDVDVHGSSRPEVEGDVLEVEVRLPVTRTDAG